VSTEVQQPPPDAAEADDMAADAAAVAAPEVIADSLGEYAKIWWARVRSGESGFLPVLLGLVAIVVYFQVRDSVFLSAGNLVNLMTQAAWIVMLGMAEVFVLLLGEIDLSIGYSSAIGATVTLWALLPPNPWPWPLAGLGLLLYVMNVAAPNSGGTIRLFPGVVADIDTSGSSGSMSPTLGWIIMAVAVVAAGALFVTRDSRRRASKLAAPPASVTWLKVAGMAVAGVVVVLIGNANRGSGLVTLHGVPWVVLVILVVVVIYSFLLGRTRFGRYMYAIGGNAEAARRAGINLSRIRVLAFTLAGLTAGIMGIILASYIGNVSTDVQGGNNVLYAVAAAVIGGTSLFGGRGKMLGAVLGGVIVAVIYNGLGILGLGAASQNIWTAAVLIAAVTVDTVARRGRSNA
jgi:D-xylose transport system permease protein